MERASQWSLVPCCTSHLTTHCFFCEKDEVDCDALPGLDLTAIDCLLGLCYKTRKEEVLNAPQVKNHFFAG